MKAMLNIRSASSRMASEDGSFSANPRPQAEAVLAQLTQLFQWLRGFFEALDFSNAGTINFPAIASSMMAVLTEAGLGHLWANFLAALDDRTTVDYDEFIVITLAWLGIDAQSETRLWPGAWRARAPETPSLHSPVAAIIPAVRGSDH